MIDEEQKKYLSIKQKIDEYKKSVELAQLNASKNPDVYLGIDMFDTYDKILFNLKKNEKSPYFAKIIFNDETYNENTTAYIGKIGFANLDDDIIVDWRAPISDLYYNSKLGKTSYVAENSLVHGTLELKRQINIVDNKVESVYDFDDNISSDEFLRPYLTQNADNRLKNIVATIQDEQNKIIRLPLNSHHIIQGVAGSGKTTVALHRLSYLTYNYKTYVKPEDYLILSPNQIFSSYISSIISDLDSDDAQNSSIEQILCQITNLNLNVLKKHEQFEKLTEKNINANYLSFKSSSEFAEIINKFVLNLQRQFFEKPLVIEGQEILSKEEVYNYYKNNNHATLEQAAKIVSKKISFDLQHYDTVKEIVYNRLKQNNVDLIKKMQIERTLAKGTSTLLEKSFPNKINIINLYTQFIKDITNYCNYQHAEILKTQTLLTLKNGIAYDDIAPILYLASKLVNFEPFAKVKHIFIDEAQDYSHLLFIALKRLYPNAYFSIFGDIAQALYSYQSIRSWNQINQIFDNCKICYLNKSYRTTIEIMQEANKTLEKLGMHTASNVIRHGDNVEYVATNKPFEIIKNSLTALQKDYKTVAVICKDKHELTDAKTQLEALDLFVLDEQMHAYENKNKFLLTVQTSKGLEFDAVIIFNENSFSNSEYDLKALYVAKTRALHKLIIIKNKA